MKTRGARRWHLFLLVALLLAGACWFLFGRNGGPIRYENFERIEFGMTKVEVDRLLGCEPGDHSSGPVRLKMKLADGSDAWAVVPFEDFDGGVEPERESARLWFGDRGLIVVEFDGDDRVRAKDHAPGRRSAPGWWLAVERWLGIGG